MQFQIPEPLREEREELHARLLLARHASGALGEAAREVTRLMQSH